MYGTIANPHVRRRERRGVIPKPTASKAAEVIAAVPKPAAPTKVKEEPNTAAPAPASTKEKEAAKKAPPSLTRGGSSGIMQSFAKAAAKPKKAQASQPVTPSVKGEDTNMTALSDDGEDDADVVPEPKPAADDTGRKSRKEREAELRRMMEEDDEDEPEQPEEKEDTPMEEPEEEPEEELPAPEPEKEEPAEVVSSKPGDGRRRGKRRVMRKKQIMDDQGYLGKGATPWKIHCCHVLTFSASHHTGTWLGVILGRRDCPACENETRSISTGSIHHKTQEVGAQGQPGEHHVFLLKKVMAGTRGSLCLHLRTGYCVAVYEPEDTVKGSLCLQRDNTRLLSQFRQG